MWSDPLLYDLELADDPGFDFTFWRELCARIGARRVLESACGTGRVTLELARAGLEVVAYDTSESFLARAREAIARAEPAVRERITLLAGDMRTPPPEAAGPFDLVAI